MKKTIFLTAVLSALLLSCSQKREGIGRSISPFHKSKVDSAYSSVRPAVQTFFIDNKKVNKIKAAHGTEVLIPANCFVTADGGEAMNVQIEVVEALSLTDFISSGLTTLSNGNLLLSNGMMFINATSGNEDLRLKDGSSLIVSMPTMTNNTGYQMFKGDGRNWTVDSSMTAMNDAIPLPLDLLYPEGHNIFLTCIVDVSGKNEKSYYLDTTILNLKQRKYENTIIATEEFKKRINLLREMMQAMSLFVNRDYYFDKVDCEGEKYNYDIWRVYLDHPKRSFRESDSIAKKMYVDYFKANKEKIVAFCEEVNRHKRAYYSNWTDTSYFFDFRKVSLEEYFMSPLKYFPPSDKEILIVNDHGVNLEVPDAFAQLSAKGIDIKGINQILGYHFKRQALIRQLQREKDVMTNREKMEQIYQTTVFSVEKMGWINCDRFFDDPTAGKAAIYVSNNSNNHLEFIDCSLVIPELNVRLSAFPDGNDRWSFTRKDGPYTRLPIGREAVITGVSIQHDSIFFAHQNIKIKDGLSVALPMKYMKRENLKDSLAVALKH